jgi:hypothetical protein
VITEKLPVPYKEYKKNLSPSSKLYGDFIDNIKSEEWPGESWKEYDRRFREDKMTPASSS